ncbi:MAG: hypothetical protein HRT58_06735 [Crocinitomicaceae bacterium]|nr:hypothetical protein [Flavobacteriales bacterium]NQZ35342.1 hypothetical protein [Crocinitomicaceae bacterium]
MKKRITIFILLSLIVNWIPFVYLITFFYPSGTGSGIYTGMGRVIILFFFVHGIIWTCLSWLYLVFRLDVFQRNLVAKGIAAILPSLIFALIVLLTLSFKDLDSIILPVIGVNMMIGIGIAITTKRVKNATLTEPNLVPEK